MRRSCSDDGTAAESYRWETLCDKMDKFAAIDVACRVGRVANDSGVQAHPPYTFAWPLKMMAFLSPARISAAQELEEVVSTVQRRAMRALTWSASFSSVSWS